MRDFALLGAGTGLLAPTVLGLVIWMTDGTWRAVEILTPVGIVCMGIGVAIGPPVGAILQAITQRLQDRPLLLFPLGFPIGAIAGAVPTYFIARFIQPWSSEAWTIGGAVGGICGGMILGAVWVPYLALRLNGRPAWPVIVGMVGLAPVIGIVMTGGLILILEFVIRP